MPSESNRQPTLTIFLLGFQSCKPKDCATLVPATCLLCNQRREHFYKGGEDKHENKQDGKPCLVFPCPLLSCLMAGPSVTNKLKVHVHYQHELKETCILVLAELWHGEKDSDCELMILDSMHRNKWTQRLQSVLRHAEVYTFI